MSLSVGDTVFYERWGTRFSRSGNLLLSHGVITKIVRPKIRGVERPYFYVKRSGSAPKSKPTRVIDIHNLSKV